MLEATTKVQFLKGVGPALGERLAARQIHSVRDLLNQLPRAYEDRRSVQKLGDLVAGALVTIRSRIIKIESQVIGRSRRRMYQIMIGDSSGRMMCRYFRVPYRGYFERFKVGDEVRVTGRVMLYRGRMEFHHPEIFLTDSLDDTEDGILPVYSESEVIKSSKLSKLIGNTIDQFQQLWQTTGQDPLETLPESVLTRHHLLGALAAYQDVHRPQLEHARSYLKFRSPGQRRLIFEDFFWLELFMARANRLRERVAAPKIAGGRRRIEELISRLGFSLTKDQWQAFQDIEADLRKPHPMHRLLQGDVGSGKTLVAWLASLFAIEGGYQVALMVPTEILAEQHIANAEKLLKPLGVRSRLLTGSLRATERRQIIQELENHEIDLLVGTHALIENPVRFARLGLSIIDEQHRFGVMQRQSLKDKAEAPHVLLMTATPIPRTLALTVFGDLDVSSIREKPVGRKPIVTRVGYESQRGRLIEFLKGQLKKGRQAYIVYPLVSESEKLDLKNAEDESARWQGLLSDFRVALIHGQMAAREKQDIMIKFRALEYHVLVSTTVIEVGVDVPNASLMIIENAERFGLSQLHQLRGRVGRGSEQSYCLLMLGHAVSNEGRLRAQIMQNTDDGFQLAEEDLKLRGPGDYLGRRQSGLIEFRLADLVRDVDIMMLARAAATDVVSADPDFSLPANQKLKDQLLVRMKNYIG